MRFIQNIDQSNIVGHMVIATDSYLGDGLLVYSIIQFMKYKTCVVLGSGGGFIPRIISQT